MIIRQSSQLSVKSLSKRIENRTISPDLAIQRNFVWDDMRKSLLIHSVLCGYPIPQIYAQDKGDNVMHLLDGKQRIGTMYEYVTDKFALSTKTPAVEDHDKDGNHVKTTEVAGMKFSELPEEMRDRIRDFDFNVINLKNLTDDIRDDFFLRINNGMPLTKIELTRVTAGSRVMEFVNAIAERPFFAKVCNLTGSARKRFVDTELVLQTLYLLSNNGEPVALDSKSIREFTEKLAKEGISEELKNTVIQTLDYLESVFVEREPDLKKVHVPIIFLYAMRSVQNEGDEITAVKFGGWVQSFFAMLRNGRGIGYNIYNPAKDASSAKKSNVEARITGMGQNFANFLRNINEAKDYVKPAVKVVDPTQPKRGPGRPRKDKTPPVETPPITEGEQLNQTA